MACKVIIGTNKISEHATRGDALDYIAKFTTRKDFVELWEGGELSAIAADGFWLPECELSIYKEEQNSVCPI